MYPLFLQPHSNSASSYKNGVSLSVIDD